MRIVEYELTPEAYGSNGSFKTKQGTIADLIIDIGMLIGADYDKVIPPYNELKSLLLRGMYPRAGEWESFVISEEEYLEVVDNLIRLPLPKPYRHYKSI
jgi:hypothetical protein